MDILDAENVAQVICGFDEAPQGDKLEAELLHRYGVTLDELFDLVEVLLPMCAMTELYQGLVSKGCWLVKKPI